ncbi:MAG: DNA repair protein RadC [Alphaproteobacteria bacterium]
MSEDDGTQGHRQRLRARFVNGGERSVADYELLEMVLFNAIPRRDTKAIAKALLDQFKSLSGVLTAPPERLSRVAGVGDAAIAAIKVVESAAHRLAREEMQQGTVLSNWQSLIKYLRASMAHLKREQFRILYLDSRNAVIADEVQNEGTLDHTSVYPREVVARALDFGAASIIMAHNHPSGDPTPSRADIAMTRQVQTAAQSLGITLHDHLIVGRAGHASFRQLGLL